MSEYLKCSKCGSDKIRLGEYDGMVLKGTYQLANQSGKWLPKVAIYMKKK